MPLDPVETVSVGSFAVSVLEAATLLATPVGELLAPLGPLLATTLGELPAGVLEAPIAELLDELDGVPAAGWAELLQAARISVIPEAIQMARKRRSVGLCRGVAPSARRASIPVIEVPFRLDVSKGHARDARGLAWLRVEGCCNETGGRQSSHRIKSRRSRIAQKYSTRPTTLSATMMAKVVAV
jgi:hypothetical protein